MQHKHASIIFGTAISAAAIVVAFDHNRQRLPEPEKQLASARAVIIIDEGEAIPAEDTADCNKPAASARQASPCSL